jgi:hypothetical protein
VEWGVRLAGTANPQTLGSSLAYYCYNCCCYNRCCCGYRYRYRRYCNCT